MKQNLYRISLPTQSAWKTIEAELIANEHKFAVVEVGHVPIPATYDENGEVLTEATAHTDWAVDIVSDETLPLTDYLAQVPAQWYNSFAGGEFNIIQPVPTDKWLKADIQQWLTDNGIEWNSSMLKSELLKLIN